MKKFSFLVLTTILFLGFSVNSFGQGSENFDGFTETGSSYADGTFVGADGSTWTFTQCRGDKPIDGATPCLGKNRDPQSKIVSGTIVNGCGTMSFDYMQAFGTPVALEVFVNGTLVTTISNSEQDVVMNTGNIVVDAAGDVVFEFVQPEGSGQASIDNLVWSEFGGTPTVATPIISPDAGTYFEAIDVTITCGTANSTIYYTLDGTDPDDNSAVYSDVVPVSTNTTVKAIAYATDMNNSGIASAEYTFSEAVLFQDWNDQEMNGWQAISMLGDQNWEITDSYGLNNTPCIKATGYDGAPFANDNWLVSPAVDFTGLTNPVFSFWNAMNYTGIAMEVKYSTDFDGTNIASATWNTLSYTPSAGAWEWTYSGDIDVSAITGTSVYFAFRFQSDDVESATWEVDDIAIVEGGTPPPPPVSSVDQDWNDQEWNGWTEVSLEGDQVWTIIENYGIDNSPCVKISGYDGAAIPNEDWLISPAFDLADYTSPVFSFYSARNYDGNVLEVFFSNDYNGTDVASATWTALSAVLSEGSFEWTPSGEVDLSGFSGDAVYVAFKFTCDDVASATWEIDNIMVADGGSVQAPVANFSADVTVATEGTTINFTDESTGTPATWEWNITGNETFSSTEQNPSFLFGTPGTYDVALTVVNDGGSDTKTEVGYITITGGGASSIIFEQNWNDQEWNGWTAISELGDQTWEITESYGIDNTPCVKATGYDGAPFANDNWLISPSANLSGVASPVFSFWTAMNYTGIALEVKYSIDFDGTSVSAATWTDLTFTASEGSWEWTYSGDIDVSSITAESVYFAFRFQSDEVESATWEIDNIELKAMTSVNNEEATAFNVYPNPASSLVKLNSAVNNGEISLFTTTGQLVYSNNFSNETTINTSDLAKGIYILKVTNLDNQASSTQRLIIK